MAYTIPGKRQPSKRCKDLVKRKEQCRLTAYLPTPEDVPTIGWGSTGPDIKLGMKWTQAQADERFERDIAKFAAGVDKRIGAVDTTQGQFDAMVSLAYNIGLWAFEGSTLLRRHRAKRYAEAAETFAWWNKQKGKVLRGLTIRRAEEAAMYREGGQ